jgi:membrane-associated phospholipid phosphatase
MKQVNKKIRNQLLLAGTALSVLVIIIVLVFIRKDLWLDNKVFELIAPYRNSFQTAAMSFISFYGNHLFLIPANLLLIAYFIIKKNKWMGVTTAVVALSSLGLMSLLKNWVQRHRPPDPLVPGITNFSFPSGHAFMSVAFYGLLIWTVTIHISHKRRQRIIVASSFLLISIIGFSRIYLRLHYTSDVLAGFCLGTLWLLFALTLMKIIEQQYTAKYKTGQGL